MKKKYLLSALILIFGSVAVVTAQPVRTLATPVPLPTATVTPSLDDEELKTQEQILAELKKLRGEKTGWTIERQGLQGQIVILTRSVSIEAERGDWFKLAAEKLQSVDKNSQRMDANSTIIQTTLETRIAEKNDKIAELTDDLRSCQQNQKWIAAVSGGVGAFAGYYIRGRVGSITGAARPDFGLYRPPTPVFESTYKPFELKR